MSKLFDKILREGAGAQLHLCVRDYVVKCEGDDVVLYGRDGAVLGNYEDEVAHSGSVRVGILKANENVDIESLSFNDGASDLNISEGFGWTSPTEMPELSIEAYTEDDDEVVVTLVPSEALKDLHFELKHIDDYWEDAEDYEDVGYSDDYDE